MSVAALIVAAGRGIRAGGAVPKQWQHIAGKPVIEHTLERFAAHPGIDRIVVVLHPEDKERLNSAEHEIALGGETRDVSVHNGLKALAADPPEHVLIHDVARPCVSDDIINAVLHALKAYPAVRLRSRSVTRFGMGRMVRF